MREVKNINLENEKKLKEARFYVFDKLIYTQKIPFSYTFLTQKGIKIGIPVALLLGAILNGFVGGGVFIWAITFIIPIEYIIYRNKINISYINRYSQVTILKWIEEITTRIRELVRTKRPLSLIPLCILFFSLQNPLYCKTMQGEVETYNKNLEEHIQYLNDEEEINSYAMREEELKKLTSTEFKTHPLKAIVEITLKQTKQLSIEQN